MQAAAVLDLARTRAAFDTWRSSQPGRRRIPQHLWQLALNLLADHSLSHVARELRLSPKYLRQRQLSAALPLRSDAPSVPRFTELRAHDLEVGSSVPGSTFNSRDHTRQLIFERTDGNRLTLCLPAADWDRIAALCSAFIRQP